MTRRYILGWLFRISDGHAYPFYPEVLPPGIVCMYVCMYVCMCVFIYMYVCMCVYVCMYVCVSMYVCALTDKVHILERGQYISISC